MRHLINFGLLFCFATLAITGAMAFLLPFSIDTTRVHVVFGLVVLVLVGLHLAGRVGYFQKQLQPASTKGARVSRPLLLGLVAAWASLLAVAIFGWHPAQWFIEESYEAQHRAEIVRSSPFSGFMDPDSLTRLIVRQPTGDADVALGVYIGFADHVETPPSIAVWAESTTGAMIETLYLDARLAYSDDPNWAGRPVPRHHVLPIWRHRYTLASGIDPTNEIDAVSAATPKHSFTLNDQLTLNEANGFVLCVEVNTPADANVKYTDPHLGQPSLLYTAYVELDSPQPYALGELTGHGGGAERDGAIRYDLTGFTTARRLIDLILVKTQAK